MNYYSDLNISLVSGSEREMRIRNGEVAAAASMSLCPRISSQSQL